MKRARMVLVAGAVLGGSLLGVAPAQAAPGTASASAAPASSHTAALSPVAHPDRAALITLGCAVATTVSPGSRGRVVVQMSQVGNVRVDVIAHIAGHPLVSLVRGSAQGTARTSFPLAHAPRGRAFPLTVIAAQGALRWSCRTTVVPR